MPNTSSERRRPDAEVGRNGVDVRYVIYNHVARCYTTKQCDLDGCSNFCYFTPLGFGVKLTQRKTHLERNAIYFHWCHRG